ncbi:MAG: translation initiation factor IF-2 [Calditrichaeota bacterium]|nr:translation initiation factor IF-2 [Calditrichota bacterium]MCB9368352.1 translation initiation factor IF-2 [Calditrichota bacterium]
MSAAKQKKIYQVAKELNVASPAIVEFLEDRGFEVSKSPKHMSPMTDEMYDEVVKKFDPSRWQEIHSAEQLTEPENLRAESERARTDQLEELLSTAAEQEIDSASTLIKQVEAEEAKREEERKTEEEKEREKAEAEARAKAEEDERQKREAEERAAERSKKEKEEIAKRRKEIEAQRAADAARKQARADAAKARSEAKTAKGEKKPAAGRPATPGTRVPRPDAGATAQPATQEGSSDQRKRRAPTKADIERIEKQKRLIAAQKQEKAKRTPAVDESRSRRKVKTKRKEVNQAEVEASIRQTLASMDSGKRRAKRRDKITGELVETQDNILQLTEFVSTQELANLMDVEVAEVIKKFFLMGKLVTINQRLERDLIELMADEFGFRVEFVSDEEEVEQDLKDEEDAPEDLVPRPPVVTVMGHVDHGKTSLLDYLRKTSVISEEHGGITQHIGAYEVVHKGRTISFLDTPGHEAFTAMRARGAQVTDLVILVISADDQVRPQTLEALSHAQSADVPVVVAINKIDRPNADPEKIRKQLAEHNVLVEQWGGKVQSAEISAKFGQGIDALLEEVLLAADILELKGNPQRRARSTVIETRIDKGRGVVATIVITNGTLHVGDYFVAGQQWGKVRTLLDENNKQIDNVGPGRPAQVVGFSGAPQAGDALVAFDSEREVKDIAMRRQLLQREQTFRQIKMLSLDQISQRIREGELRELPLIIKGDADGSVEAICDQLQRLGTKEVAVKIVHRGVGAISESDVLLAAATGSIILGFHVHPNLKAREFAMRESVDIRVYRIIYEMENDIREALEGMLRPDKKEEVVGLIEVRQTFRVPSAGTIAGCFVVSGIIKRQSQIRLLRDGKQIWSGTVGSLKRFKNDVSEVKSGYECGILLHNMNDVKEGDSIEVIQITEIKRTLEQSVA